MIGLTFIKFRGNAQVETLSIPLRTYTEMFWLNLRNAGIPEDKRK